MSSSLINRNVVVDGRRTSIRLEADMWDALTEVCQREGCRIHELATMVNSTRRESTLTAAIRVFIMNYYRAAATEQGHARSGHGKALRPGRADRSAIQRRLERLATGRGGEDRAAQPVSRPYTTQDNAA